MLVTDWHECAKPDEPKIELAKARAGALWRCSECGPVWELQGRHEDGYGPGFWIWAEFQQAESWGGDR